MMDGYKYSLAVIYTNASVYGARKYVWGFCAPESCNKSSLVPLTSFIKETKFYVDKEEALNLSATEVEYLLPTEDLIEEKIELQTGFWIIVSILIAGGVLGILGIFVEYTRLGNLKLSHEETNFSNIDIPMLHEGSTYE
jgi:hypothetical protein